MATVSELKEQRAQLDAQFAVAKAEGIKSILMQMAELGISAADLTRAGAPRITPASDRPAKYRDAKGNTWTGIGQRPRWIKAAVMAGASLDDFKV